MGIRQRQEVKKIKKYLNKTVKNHKYILLWGLTVLFMFSFISFTSMRWLIPMNIPANTHGYTNRV